MLRLELQFFGGRGASYGISKDESYEQKEKQVSNTIKEIVKAKDDKYKDAILTDDKLRSVKNETIKEIAEKTGLSELNAERYYNRMANKSRDEFEGKTYFKNSNGEIQDLQIKGNTNFELVRKDGGKATAYVVISGNERGVAEIKPVNAFVYNIDGRDIAIHKPYGSGSGKGYGWMATDVATGMGFGVSEGTKEKVLASVRSTGRVASVKSAVEKIDDRRSIEIFKTVQKKLIEEKNRKKR